MGWTWEVEAYVRDPFATEIMGRPAYRWEKDWTGESFVLALLAMRRAKKEAGAVRLTWR